YRKGQPMGVASAGRPLDGGRGWVIVLACFLAQLLAFGSPQSVGVLYPEWLSTYQEGKGMTAWVGSIVSGVALITTLYSTCTTLLTLYSTCTTLLTLYSTCTTLLTLHLYYSTNTILYLHYSTNTILYLHYSTNTILYLYYFPNTILYLHYSTSTILYLYYSTSTILYLHHSTNTILYLHYYSNTILYLYYSTNTILYLHYSTNTILYLHHSTNTILYLHYYSPLCSVCVDSFGARPVTIFSGVMVAGGLMLSAFAPNVSFLIFSYGIVGGLLSHPVTLRLLYVPVTLRLLYVPVALRLLYVPVTLRLLYVPVTLRLLYVSLTLRLLYVPLTLRLLYVPVTLRLLYVPLTLRLLYVPLTLRLLYVPVTLRLLYVPLTLRLLYVPVMLRLLYVPVTLRLLYVPVTQRLLYVPLTLRLFTVLLSSHSLVISCSPSSCSAEPHRLLVPQFSSGTGMGCGLVYAATLTITCQYFDKRRGLALGIVTTGTSAGGFLYATLQNELIELFGLDGCLLIIGAASLNLMACAGPMRPLNFPGYYLKQKAALAHTDEPLYDKPSTIIIVTGDDRDTGPAHKTPGTTTKELLISSEPGAAEWGTPHSALVRAIKRRARAHARYAQQVGGYLGNRPFAALCVCIFLFSLGAFPPVLFMEDVAQSAGLAEHVAAVPLVSVVAAATGAGKLVLGALADAQRVSGLHLYALTAMASGAALLLVPVSRSYAGLQALCAVLGFFSGNWSLTPYVTTRMVGVEHLSQAHGILMCFGGFGIMLGPPVVGWLFDWTQSYDLAFYFSGSCVVAGGALLFLATLPCWGLLESEGNTPAVESPCDSERENPSDKVASVA
ncbi:hypothetical protein P4O66_011446, partial [Electrophorus voltai]